MAGSNRSQSKAGPTQPTPEQNNNTRQDALKDVQENKTVNDGGDIWPFYPTYAMSQVEQTVYWRLVESLPDYIVLAQVQASRVLKLRRGQNAQYWFNRINRMSYDFVVCQKNSYPLAVVELDDSSHRLPERQEADRRKDKALSDAGLTLIRWQVNAVPGQAEIQELFSRLNEDQQMKRQQYRNNSSSGSHAV